MILSYSKKIYRKFPKQISNAKVFFTAFIFLKAPVIFCICDFTMDCGSVRKSSISSRRKCFSSAALLHSYLCNLLTWNFWLWKMNYSCYCVIYQQHCVKWNYEPIVYQIAVKKRKLKLLKKKAWEKTYRQCSIIIAAMRPTSPFLMPHWNISNIVNICFHLLHRSTSGKT